MERVYSYKECVISNRELHLITSLGITTTLVYILKQAVIFTPRFRINVNKLKNASYCFSSRYWRVGMRTALSLGLRPRRGSEVGRRGLQICLVVMARNRGRRGGRGRWRGCCLHLMMVIRIKIRIIRLVHHLAARHYFIVLDCARVRDLGETEQLQLLGAENTSSMSQCHGWRRNAAALRFRVAPPRNQSCSAVQQ